MSHQANVANKQRKSNTIKIPPIQITKTYLLGSTNPILGLPVEKIEISKISHTNEYHLENVSTLNLCNLYFHAQALCLITFEICRETMVVPEASGMLDLACSAAMHTHDDASLGHNTYIILA